MAARARIAGGEPRASGRGYLAVFHRRVCPGSSALCLLDYFKPGFEIGEALLQPIGIGVKRFDLA